jgi:hypothetical protein
VCRIDRGNNTSDTTDRASWRRTRGIEEAGALELLTLKQASRESGYSTDHLARLVTSGTIPNCGRRGKPLIARGNLPIKPGYLPRVTEDSQLSARRRIVASVITGEST